MIRIQVASANSSSANTTNRPASESETVWGGSPRAPRAARGEPPQSAGDQDAGRFLVTALLLFALATWILIMAWMSRHAYYAYQLPGH